MMEALTVVVVLLLLNQYMRNAREQKRERKRRIERAKAREAAVAKQVQARLDEMLKHQHHEEPRLKAVK